MSEGNISTTEDNQQTNEHVLGDISDLAGKYLTFSLNEEVYGLVLLKVQEIIGVMHITQVPKSPSYVKGVINLRGKIIPVMDLRLKFGMEEKAYDKQTCIIVVNVTFNDEPLAVGIIVDTVLEVIDFTASQLQPAPEYGTCVDANFIDALGKVEEQVVILVDINKAVGNDVEAIAAM